MKLKHLAVAIAIVGMSTGALANDVNNDITGLGGTTFFGALHTDSFDFVDVFTFNVVGPVNASASLVTIGFTPTQNINFLTATLNGNPLTLSPNGNIETGATVGELSLTGPLVLTVTGQSGASGGQFASYSGTMNVTAVPEPGTLALLFAGLGGIQVMGRRRPVQS